VRIAIGSDHAAVDLRERLVESLRSWGHAVEDLGTRDRASCDYPDFAHAVADKVASGDADRGVLVCGSGIGMSMAANRHPGVRAALCGELLSARLSRLHNDANVLCLGARLVGPEHAIEILKVWLETDYEGERHARRVAKIERGGG
jgi:ribose 5-phosphate isomerase B